MREFGDLLSAGDHADSAEGAQEPQVNLFVSVTFLYHIGVIPCGRPIGLGTAGIGARMTGSLALNS